MRRMLLPLVTALCCMAAAMAQITAPRLAGAGEGANISVQGSGTLYVIGPTARVSRKVEAGAVQLRPEELRDAGRYLLVLKSGDEVHAATMYVTAAKTERLSFLAQPSRVPAGVRNVISGTVFVFDSNHNLVLKPQQVKFDLSVADGPHLTRVVTSNDGVAWTRMDSAKKEGAALFVASAGDTDVKRVVQQVAAEPCNLRMKAESDPRGILVRTDPIRDCAGNAVPDGTIVTFTQVDRSGISTVDARIKRDIASAVLPAPTGAATISVASGVVAGNEITIHGGGQ
jgi:hypothetical protein